MFPLSLMLTGTLPEVLLFTHTSYLLAGLVAGMLLSSQFPVNYFSISEVEQFYPAFADEYGQFERSLGGAGKFWRFNRLHDYANKACQVPGLGSLLGCVPLCSSPETPFTIPYASLTQTFLLHGPIMISASAHGSSRSDVLGLVAAHMLVLPARSLNM